MADFDLEQLKTLFESLSQRLDDTAGDSATRRELEKIKATIRQLSNHIQKNASKNDPVENRQFIRDFFTEWDRQNPLREVREAVDDLNETITKNPLRGDGGGGGVGGPADGVLDMLEPEVKSNKTAMAGLGKAAGKLGGILSAVGGTLSGAYVWMKDQANDYRRVLGSAEGSITSIMDMRNTAAQNDMTVESMITSLERYESVRSIGAKDFAKFNKTVRDATFSTGLLGMSTEQMRDAQANYLEIIRGTGNLNTLDTDVLSNHFQKLIGVNQEMAGIMGKTREEQLEATKRESTDARFNAALRAAGVDDTSRNNILTMLDGMSEQEKQAFKEMVASGGAPVTQDSAAYLAISGQLGQNLQSMSEQIRQTGRLGERDTIAFTEQNRQLATDMSKDGAMGQVASIMAMRGDAMALGYVEALDKRLRQNEAIAKTDKTAPGGPGMQERSDLALLSIEDAENRIAASITDNFNQVVGSMFDAFGGQMQRVTNGARDAADSLHDLARKAEGNPDTMLTVGVVGSILAIVTPAVMAILGIKGGRGVLGKLFSGSGANPLRGGAGAGMGAGAGGAGGLLRGAAGAVGRAGLIGLGTTVGVMGIADGASRVNDDSKLNVGLGYGEAAGSGALAGAALGSVIPGLGTVIGAGIGGIAGLAYAGWQDYSQEGGLFSGQEEQKPSHKKANASTNPTSGPNEIELSSKLLEVQSSALNQLTAIRNQTKEQLDLLREEVLNARTYNDRIVRLLEENNRYTREIPSLA